MSLKIALIGYGQMGKAVETIALQRGHTISHRIDRNDSRVLSILKPTNTDIAIEFTQPEAAFANIQQSMECQIPLVTGTTGWYDSLPEVEKCVAEHQGALMWSSNFSVGVNILFKMNQVLAELMNRYPEYDPLIEEKHHRFKKDAPSGTAKTLAQDLLTRLDRKDTLITAEQEHRAPNENELSVSYSRAGRIVGEHNVVYTSAVDEITLSHRAFDRSGFALGAVIAAEWLKGKKGIYNFSDIFA